MKKCIAVLTRGYSNIREYNTLIQRNVSIAQNLIDKSIDVVIFHEGNITDIHQGYIKKATPRLNLIFICISDKAFKDEKKQVVFHESTKGFSLNYRHMCSFWFVDYWEYVNEYDLLIRIDEDCKIDFSIDNIFKLLEIKSVVFGKWETDEDKVTFGLNEFTMRFLREEKMYNKIKMRKPSGPYTNVFGLNLSELRKNSLLQKYIDRIKESNFIYTHRWGDLPLWGEVLTYMCDPNNYIYLRNLNYYHGSHNRNVGKPSDRFRFLNLMT